MPISSNNRKICLVRLLNSVMKLLKRRSPPSPDFLPLSNYLLALSQDEERLKNEMQSNKTLLEDINNAHNFRQPLNRSYLAALYSERITMLLAELQRLDSYKNGVRLIKELVLGNISDNLRPPVPTSELLFAALENERMRIGRDIHDGPAQALSNLVLQVEVMEKLLAQPDPQIHSEFESFKKNVQGTLVELRHLIFDLHPMSLEDLGLLPALQNYLTDYQKNTSIQVGFTLLGNPGTISASLEQNLFRIIQEALNNVKKHSKASQVVITFEFQSS